MTGIPDVPFDDLSAADKGRINAVCARFEATLREGRPVAAARFLDAVPDHLRPNLLVELVRLECEGRPAAAEFRAAASRAGPYVLAEELGRGAFGVVHKATDSRDGQVYALKTPLPAVLAHPEFPSRFRREAAAALRLDHPNIVRTREMGGGPAYYLVTDYVDGPTLAAWLDARHEPVPVRRAAELVAAVADAIEHAHARGVIHRDLKPGNILLGGPDLTPKVTDFGHALLAESDSATGSGVVAGTPAYMAPEQATADRRQVSPRTDVYALGAVLYELLVGRPPFAGDNPMRVLVQTLTREPLAPRTARPEVPRDLEAVCLRCLEKRPAERFGSAGEVAEELRRFLTGSPTRTRGPGPARRAWRWARRHKVAAALIAATLIGVAATLGGLATHTARLDAANADLTAALAERDATNRQLRRVAYVADIRQADELLTRGAVREAVRVLSRWEPRPGEDDLRGWEWHHLRHKVGHGVVAEWAPGVMFSLAFSPDGRTLAGGGEDRHAHLWDSETGRGATPPFAHAAEVRRVAWTPGGTRLATADGDGVIRVWRPGGHPPRVLTGHSEIVSSLAVSPDGRSLASAGKDGSVRVWDLADDRTPPVVRPAGRLPARAVGFTPDGRSLVLGWGEGEPEVVAADDPARLRCTLHDHSALLVAAMPVPDGFVTVGRLDACVWDWHPAEGRATLRFRVPGQETRINDAAVSPDARLLAVATDGGVRVWDIRDRRPRGLLTGHEGRVWAVAFHPDGDRLATAGADGTVRVWRLSEAEAAREPPAVVTSHNHGIALLPQSHRLAVRTTRPDAIELWSYGRPGFVRVARWPIAGDSELSATSDGHGVLTHDGRGRIVRTAPKPSGANGGEPAFTATTLGQLPPDDCEGVKVVVDDPAGSWLAASRKSEVIVWDRATGRIVSKLSGHRRMVTALAAHPAGAILASGGNDRICLWDVPGGRLLAPPVEVKNSVRALAFGPDGTTLAGGGEDQVVRLWDLRGNLVRQYFGHRGTVASVGFAADGRTLVSGGEDGTVRLWRVDAGGELLTVASFGGPVCFAGFSPDGRFLVTAGREVPGEDSYRIRVHDCGYALATQSVPLN